MKLAFVVLIFVANPLPTCPTPPLLSVLQPNQLPQNYLFSIKLQRSCFDVGQGCLESALRRFGRQTAAGSVAGVVCRVPSGAILTLQRFNLEETPGGERRTQ